MDSQLKVRGCDSRAFKELYAGFYMMCCRLYIEAIDRALLKIEKFYLPRVSGIEKMQLNRFAQQNLNWATPELLKSKKDIFE